RPVRRCAGEAGCPWYRTDLSSEAHRRRACHAPEECRCGRGAGERHPRETRLSLACTFYIDICNSIVYIRAMRVTATVLRSHLFEALEKAVQGEPVEVSYKGKLLRIIPESGASKLARAKRQHALAV